MKVWVAMHLDRYDGGRGFVAVADTDTRARALAEIDHRDRYEDGTAPTWRTLEIVEHQGIRMGPKHWGSPFWTADSGPSSWYDVVPFDVDDERDED